MIVSQLVCGPDHNSLSLSPQMHSEVVSEMLRGMAGGTKETSRTITTQETCDDDESRLYARIWVKAKGFATKKVSLLLDTLVEQRTMRSCWRCLEMSRSVSTTDS